MKTLTFLLLIHALYSLRVFAYYGLLKKCELITALVLIQFISKPIAQIWHASYFWTKKVSIWSQKCYLFECFEFRVKCTNLHCGWLIYDWEKVIAELSLLGPPSAKAIKNSLDQIELNLHHIRKNKLTDLPCWTTNFVFKYPIYNGYKQMGKPFNNGYVSECSKMCHSNSTMAKNHNFHE